MKVEAVEDVGSVYVCVLDEADAVDGLMACRVEDEATTTVSLLEARPTNG